MDENVNALKSIGASRFGGCPTVLQLCFVFLVVVAEVLVCFGIHEAVEFTLV